MKAFVPAVAVALLLVPQAEDPTKGWKHRWSGAVVGQWVKFKVTRFRPDPESPDLLQAWSVERRITVRSAVGNHVGLEIAEGEELPRAENLDLALPVDLRRKWTEVGKEDVPVANKRFACRIFETRIEQGSTARVRKVWIAEGSPCWAIRVHWFREDDGIPTEGGSEELAGTDQPVKVGDRTFSCLVFRRNESRRDGGRLVTNEWTSDEVPGGLVKREIRVLDRKQFEIRLERVEEDLVAFQREP